jgi:hypothetical protein
MLHTAAITTIRARICMAEREMRRLARRGGGARGLAVVVLYQMVATL